MIDGKKDEEQDLPKGIIATIVKRSLDSFLSFLLLIIGFSLGLAALLLTPEEEEPQIVVPMADVYVNVPGSDAKEVENLVSTPLEQLLWQIDGVEYVYSTSMDNQAVVTVRYYVGEDRQKALVNLYNKINSHIDEAPPIVKNWIIKPIEIDDVPIVNLTFHSETYKDDQLKRIVEEMRAHLEEVENISRTIIVGGRDEQLRVAINPNSLKAHNLTLLEVVESISTADSLLTSGSFDHDNRTFFLRAGPQLKHLQDVQQLVVGVFDNKPVYLADVADISIEPQEAENYSRILYKTGHDFPKQAIAVTIGLAKKKGTNAVVVADEILSKVEELKKSVLPSEVTVTVTRNYGDTAYQKVKELIKSLFYGIVTIVVILLIFLGLREGFIVALSVPFSFALALYTNYLFGYTINRVTLFALILTLGLVVDDPIINVDNIQRHLFKRKHSRFKAIVLAVQEVLPPVIISTLTIVVSFLPMFYITGMMGPYMRPMAINVPLAVIYSTIAALTIVPWAAYHLLEGREPDVEVKKNTLADKLMNLYTDFLRLFLEHKRYRWGLLATILALVLLSGLLVTTHLVPLKMLPFDNKNELQLVIDMPEGTTLEYTDAVARDFENYLIEQPEVENLVSFVGTHSPIDFNGLVRHYYFRNQPNQADIRINLIDKTIRKDQSHEIALRIRQNIDEIGKRNNAKYFILESPPGPPVVSTIVAEVYGSPGVSYDRLIEGAHNIAARLDQIPGAEDIDITAKKPASEFLYNLDKVKSSIAGIQMKDAAESLDIAMRGRQPTILHKESERKPMLVEVRLSEADRSNKEIIGNIGIKSKKGDLVTLNELGVFDLKTRSIPIYHKNLRKIVYVFAETIGRTPAEIVLDLNNTLRENPLSKDLSVDLAGEGEWFITLKVFRDLGIAFGAALLGIYLILAIQTNSLVLPLVQMSAIPLTIIGVLPGFFLLNFLTKNTINGYENPVFFTATAMIGLIALGGIVIRNSSVLISFIQDKIAQGISMKEAILESGVVRMRPIILTALTTAIGVWPITLDPIFSGLGWTLIFGVLASTAFSLIVVPVAFWSIYRPKDSLT
jgi:multidrug efflux pump subunit AcrB